MELHMPVRRAKRGWLAAAIAVIALGGGAIAALGAAEGTIPASFVTFQDVGGANDVVAQSDLTQLGRDDTDANYYKLFWSWDETDQWTGTGQTGDACALFDSDNDGKINVAVCGQIHNVNADVNVVKQNTGSPFVFTCGDTKADRCAQPTGPLSRTVSQVTAGQVGSESGGVLAANDNLITHTDPFPAGDDFDRDSTLQVNILKTYLNTLAYGSATPPTGKSVVLANVCSYPSAGNGGNNNPFDCINIPGTGFLKIIKQTPANTTGAFTFSVSPAPESPQPATYTLNPATAAGASVAEATTGNINEAITTAGIVTETALPSGWTIGTGGCTLEGGTATGTFSAANKQITAIRVNSGKVTTCTITNTPVQPKLTVTKTVVNGYGVTKTVTDFTYSVDSTTVLSGVKNTFAVGGHTVSEGTHTGFTEVIGGDCAADGTVTLALGDDKTCTITNTAIQPKLTVTKTVNNGYGVTKSVTDFTYYVDSTTVLSGVKNGFNTGSHTVSEGAHSGFTEVIGGDCASDGTVSLALGDDKTCTISNTAIQPKLTVTKTINNGYGVTKVVTDFTYYVDTTVVSSGVQNGFDAGSHTVSEGDHAGFTEVIGGDCASDGTVTLALGDAKACTITNTAIQPKLTVVKTINNGYGVTKVLTDFTYYIDATAVTSGTKNNVNAGSHTVSEGAHSGFTEVIGGACASDGTVTLALGDDLTCTITNTAIQPKLTVTKVVIDNFNGGKVVSDFPLFVDSTSVTSGAQTGFNAGSHTVSETTLTGYTGVITGDCAADGSVTLSLGDVKACTITNTYSPATPSGVTVETWRLYDSIALTGIRHGAPNESTAKVTFRLYSSCDQATGVGSVLVGSEAIDLAGGDSAATANGVLVSASGTYYWTAQYSGDNWNTGFTTSCADEVTQILAKDSLGTPDRNDFVAS